MKKMVCTVAMLLAIVCVNVGPVGASEPSSSPSPKVTLTCQATPLKSVVDSVSSQTGYTIHVEESLLNMPITGDFKETEITQFFQRILRGENLSLLFAEKDKTCIVRTFGKKEGKFYTAGKVGQVDSLTGLTLDELKASHDEQRRAFMEYSLDPEAVDPLTGLKLGDLKESDEEQRNAFLEKSQDRESVDSLVGKKQGDVKKLEEQQKQTFQAFSDNPESVDALTGQKIAELKKTEEVQRQEFQRTSSDPNTIDPLTGMSLGQLRELQENQRNEFLGKT